MEAAIASGYSIIVCLWASLLVSPKGKVNRVTFLLVLTVPKPVGLHTAGRVRKGTGRRILRRLQGVSSFYTASRPTTVRVRGVATLCVVITVASGPRPRLGSGGAHVRNFLLGRGRCGPVAG